jgi:hypothetical protein
MGSAAVSALPQLRAETAKNRRSDIIHEYQHAA